MKYGLSIDQLDEIKQILAGYPAVETAVIFGSRAIDTYKEASDVDIAIKGEQADLNIALKIKDHLEEETYLPFFFDVVAYGSISSDELKKHIDTKGKVIFDRRMDEWEEVKLDSVLEIKYGKAHRALDDGNIPCIGSGGIMRYVNDSIYDKVSILIPRKGSLNNIMYQDNPFWTVDTMFWSIVNEEKVNPKFLFYQLTLIDYTNLNVGSAVPSLTVPVINKIDVSLPEKEEQNVIAEVLSSLDDKIDLLHRQNQTLEKMAETLFRQRFVEEAQDDWEEGTLNEVLSVKGGTTPSTKKPEFWNGDIHWTSPKDITSSDSIYLFDTERKITKKGLSKISSGLLPKGTLLMSSRAPVGILTFAEIPLAINQGYIAILDDKGFSKEFLYLWIKFNINYVRSYSNGSTFLEISKSVFKNLEIKIPPENICFEFQKFIIPYFDKIKLNQTQIHTLESLRDTLLPKLISGEIRVVNDEYP